MDKKPEVSVVMACYREPLEYVKTAINSILNQTYKDFELIIILNDANNKKLYDFLQNLSKQDERINLHISNFNLGIASRFIYADIYAKGDYVAIMDADDIAFPDRLEKQVQILKKGIADVVSGCIEEFDDERKENKIIGVRKIPEKHEDILKFAKKRNPVNDPATMFKRECLNNLKGLGVLPYFGLEYMIWVKLMKEGCRFYNIQEPILRFRFNRRTYMRRRGLGIFCSEWKVLRFMKDIGFLNKGEYYFNLLTRFTARVLLSPFIAYIYAILRRL